MSFRKAQLNGQHVTSVQQVAAGTLRGPDGSPVIACCPFPGPPPDGRALFSISEALNEGGPLRYIDPNFAAGTLTSPDGRPVMAVYVVDAVGAGTALGGFTPTLGVLTLSNSVFTIGTPANGTIGGATAGSAIGLAGAPPGFTINSAARTWSYDGSGPVASANLTLTETLAGATGSPKATAIAWIVKAAGGGGGGGNVNRLDFSAALNSGYLALMEDFSL